MAKGTKLTLGDEEPTHIVTDIEVSTKVAPRPSSADTVLDELHSLSLSDMPVVYEAEWRTKVALDDGSENAKKPSVSQLRVYF